MDKITWIIVNCNSKREAENIGRAVLKMRLISCFDIIPRYLAAYFWPPRTGKIQTSKGATLILESFENKFKRIKKRVEEMHSDQLPLIGFIHLEGIEKKYGQWMKNEIK